MPRRRKYLAWVRNSLLILFGCIPATVLCYLAVPLAISGMIGPFAGDGWLSVGMSLWGIGGIVGTFSLWRICLGFPSPLSYFGLIIGICSNLPILALFPQSYTAILFSGDWVILFAPTLIAFYLLVELVYSAWRIGLQDKESVATTGTELL